LFHNFVLLISEKTAREAENVGKVMSIQSNIVGKYEVRTPNSMGFKRTNLHIKKQSLVDPQRRFIREGEVNILENQTKVSLG